MKFPGLGEIPRSQRLVLIVVMAIVVIAIVQAQWWIIELANTSPAVTAPAAGTPGTAAPATAPILDPAAARAQRIRRFALEASFLLTVLTAALAGIASGFFTELKVRRTQDSFLALVSHQFKTPLASLKLAIETLMLRRELPAHLEHIVGRAHDDVERLENLIKNILESARLDEGRVTLRREPLSLSRMIEQTVERLSERARRAGVDFELDVPQDLYALADPVATDAVLRNLLENAIAAVAPIGKGTIRVMARASGDRAEVEIIDSGVGFDMVDASKLFDKFGRSDPAYRSSERTGLGLNIAQRLMQLGGGDIRAHSEGLGKGASFCVVWPRTEASAS
jgi:signal transduction histidine kinase